MTNVPSSALSPKGRGEREFTRKERAYLMSLPAVLSISGRRIYYAPEFRDDCLHRYEHGESPVAMFREAGLDPKLIGYKRIERCFARWRQAAGQPVLPVAERRGAAAAAGDANVSEAGASSDGKSAIDGAATGARASRPAGAKPLRRSRWNPETEKDAIIRQQIVLIDMLQDELRELREARESQELQEA